MKRFTILAIMALFLLGTVATASAVDMKASGSWRVSGNWWQNQQNFDDDKQDDNFNVMQRARTYFEFIANENLKGVLKTEIGDFVWGNGDAGSTSGDAVAIEVKNAYLDFNVPNTEVNIKAGLQGLTLPGFVGGSPLFSDDVTGITFNAPITDMVGVTGGWARLRDDSMTKYGGYMDGANASVDDSGDNLDLAFLGAPLTFDGVQFVPYMGYAWIGKGILDDMTNATGANAGPWGTYSDDGAGTGGTSNMQPWMRSVAGLIGDLKYDDSSAWFAGIPFKLDMFDPLVVSADAHYGRMDLDVKSGGDDVEIKGWLADLAVEYKMDMMTPTVFASYSTGLDKDDVKDRELGIYPAVDGYWAMDTMLTDGGAFSQSLDLYVPVSMWTVGARLNDMSFVEDLTHSVGIMYARGTSDKEVTSFGKFGLLNEDESLLALDFTTKYMIYENLAAIAELGYAKYDADYETETKGVYEDDTDSTYKGVIGLQYNF